MNILDLIGRTSPLFEEDIASKAKQIEDLVSSSSFWCLEEQVQLDKLL